MMNGHASFPKKRQMIGCGAVVRLDDPVINHGILFIHPELPPIKLHLELDLEKRTISRYAFESIKPEHGEQTEFAVLVHEELESPILQPDKKLIKPS